VHDIPEEEKVCACRACQGVDLSRATMCSRAIQAAQRLQPLLELLRDQIRAGP